MLLMAARTAPALDDMTVMPERPPLRDALTRMRARKIQHVPVTDIAEIDAGAHGMRDADGSDAVIFHPHAPQDGIAVLEDAVCQHGIESKLFIPQDDGEAFRPALSDVDGRQAGEAALPLRDTVRPVAEIRDARAVCLKGADGRLAEIRIAVGRVFLCRCVKGEITVAADGICRERAIHARYRACTVEALDARSPIEMAEPAARQDVHDIARVRCLDVELFFLFIK